MASFEISLKRVYEHPSPEDGTRILVERLWPRGLRREDAAIDHWVKDVSPSPDLRKWYGHQPDLWPEFQKRYRAELAGNREAVEAAAALCAVSPVTFVYAAKDEERNSAVVLRDYLRSDFAKS